MKPLSISAFQFFSLSAVTTFALLFPVRALLRRLGVVDKPNARSSHTVVTVRGGGVAIVAVLAGVMILMGTTRSAGYADTALPLLVAFVVLAVVSFIDDLRGLPARVRFGVQVLCAVTAVVALGVTNGTPRTIDAATIAAGFVAVVWIAGYTNAFNFMDGINGLAAAQAIVTGLGTAAIAIRLGIGVAQPPVVIALAIAGAALGFLPHNFPRARVFMGDVSSATLGFLLAALAFWIAQLTSWWILFWIGLLHANFVLDTGITLLRRGRRGDRLSEAHREHFYQRLVRAGASHTQVTLAEAGIQILAAIALWWATPNALRANGEGRMQNGEWGCMLAVAVGVIGVWLAFFAYAEGRFGKAMKAVATKRQNAETLKS